MIASADILIAGLAAWLWTSFVAPVIARGFGVPIVSGWRLNRRNQHLSKSEYVWGCGAFAFGTGLFTFLTLRQCLYCIITSDKLPHLAGSYLGPRLLLCIAAGWLFGVFTAPQREVSDFPLQ